MFLSFLRRGSIPRWVLQVGILCLATIDVQAFSASYTARINLENPATGKARIVCEESWCVLEVPLPKWGMKSIPLPQSHRRLFEILATRGAGATVALHERQREIRTQVKSLKIAVDIDKQGAVQVRRILATCVVNRNYRRGSGIKERLGFKEEILENVHLSRLRPIPQSVRATRDPQMWCLPVNGMGITRVHVIQVENDEALIQLDPTYSDPEQMLDMPVYRIPVAHLVRVLDESFLVAKDVRWMPPETVNELRSLLTSVGRLRAFSSDGLPRGQGFSRLDYLAILGRLHSLDELLSLQGVFPVKRLPTQPIPVSVLNLKVNAVAVSLGQLISDEDGTYIKHPEFMAPDAYHFLSRTQKKTLAILMGSYTHLFGVKQPSGAYANAELVRVAALTSRDGQRLVAFWGLFRYQLVQLGSAGPTNADGWEWRRIYAGTLAAPSTHALQLSTRRPRFAIEVGGNVLPVLVLDKQEESAVLVLYEDFLYAYAGHVNSFSLFSYPLKSIHRFNRTSEALSSLLPRRIEMLGQRFYELRASRPLLKPFALISLAMESVGYENKRTQRDFLNYLARIARGVEPKTLCHEILSGNRVPAPPAQDS